MTKRGLAVNDPQRALGWLKRVSYYRFSAYFIPFKDITTNRFKSGSEFSQIAELYKFDSRLRLLILQAIERVEIALRTALTYRIAHTYGPFGHVLSTNFSPSFDHAKFMQELSVEETRSRETFVQHYRSKYTSEPHLPIWMATELISFGALSLMYSAVRPDIQRTVATEYGIPGDILKNWLHTLSYVRNNCAHHKRLWNRELAIRPKIPRNWQYPVVNNERIYCVLIILQHFTSVICPSCKWRDRVVTLMDSLPLVDVKAMGFPNHWRTQRPWA